MENPVSYTPITKLHHYNLSRSYHKTVSTQIFYSYQTLKVFLTMNRIKDNALAIPFEVTDYLGNKIRLNDYKGKKVL